MSRDGQPGWGLGLALALLALAASGSPAARAWEQSADYRIVARYEPETRRTTGAESILYRNHSPDTLREVWLHLRHRALRPGTAMDASRERDGLATFRSLPESAWGEASVDAISAGGKGLNLELLEATAHTRLPLPLPPGDSLVFEITFHDRLPGIPVHSGATPSDFALGEWYPKICVYDSAGWHADPWLSRGEFFSDFGAYDVRLTVPGEYLLAHTGRLCDPESVLTQGALTRLAGLGERPIRVSDGRTRATRESPELTWRLRADHVHDFGIGGCRGASWWAARTGNTAISAMGAPSTDAILERICAFGAGALADFSVRFGAYPDSAFTFLLSSSVGASIEKPNLAWISRERASDPDTRRLELTLAHEAAHAWFYSRVANNENRDPWMDEGLATYAALRHVERALAGDSAATIRSGAPSPWKSREDFRSELYREQWEWESRGRVERADLPADRYASGESYRRAAYGRAGLMWLELESRWGEPALEAALRGYASDWSERHPAGSDLERSLSRGLGADLDSTFHFWLHSIQPITAGALREPPRGMPGSRVRPDTGVPGVDRADPRGISLWLRPSLQYDDPDGPALGSRVRLAVPAGDRTLAFDLRLPLRRSFGGYRPQVGLSGSVRHPGLGGSMDAAMTFRTGEGRNFEAMAVSWQPWSYPGSRALRLMAGYARIQLVASEYLRERNSWRPGIQDEWETSISVPLSARHTETSLLRMRGSGVKGTDSFLRLDGLARLWPARKIAVHAAVGTFPILRPRGGGTPDPAGPAPQELFGAGSAGTRDEYEYGPLRSRGLFGPSAPVGLEGDAGLGGYAGRNLRARDFASLRVRFELGEGGRIGEEGGIPSLEFRPYVLLEAAGLGGVQDGQGPDGFYADAGLGSQLRLRPWKLAAEVNAPLWVSRPGGSARRLSPRLALIFHTL